jgi:hypothetical protein
LTEYRAFVVDDVLDHLVSMMHYAHSAARRATMRLLLAVMPQYQVAPEFATKFVDVVLREPLPDLVDDTMHLIHVFADASRANGEIFSEAFSVSVCNHMAKNIS